MNGQRQFTPVIIVIIQKLFQIAFFQIQRGKLTTLVNKFMWVSRVFGILYISGITLERMHVYGGAKVRERGLNFVNLILRGSQNCAFSHERMLKAALKFVNVLDTVCNILSLIPDVHTIYSVSKSRKQ